MSARYIMRNRSLPSISHGQHRCEFIIYAEDGAEVDRLEVTPSTARWVAGNSGLEFISPAHAYALGAMTEARP